LLDGKTLRESRQKIQAGIFCKEKLVYLLDSLRIFEDSKIQGITKIFMYRLFLLILAIFCLSASNNSYADEVDMDEDPSDMDVIDSRSQIKIALLLPLTGSYSAIGKSSLLAAEMAIFDTGNLGEEILLIPVDTGTTEKEAVGAAKKAAELKPDLIIGPILSNTTKAAQNVLRNKNIPVISLANNSSLAENNMFVMGYFPEDQVAREIEFARKSGYGKFYSLLPEDKYGERVAQSMKATLLNDRIEPEQIIWVGEGESSLTKAAIKLKELYTPEKIKANGSAKAAILIPTGGSSLSKMLGSVQIGKMKILGSSDWEDLEILKKPALEGSWLSVPPQELFQVFSSKYKKIYGEFPYRTSSLVYDAVSLAANLAVLDSSNPYSVENISRPEGFVGVNGIFRFRADGRVERKLAVVEVSPEGFKEVDPSPESF
jgi:branched-chain amino acid transport system substrate-binding protein